MKKIQTLGIVVAKILLTTVLLFGTIFCATADAGEKLTLVETEKLTLIETEERMFWEIHGTSTDGTPSKVYVLGTIHIGDERLYPLAEPIQSALENADRIVGELSAADTANIKTVFTERMLAKVSASLRIEDPLTNYLSQEEITFLKSSMPPELLQSGYMCDPWFLLTLLTALEIEKTELTAKYGLDLVITDLVAERGSEIEGVETLETQVTAILYDDFNFEEQLQILQDTIKGLIEAEKTGMTIDDMYEVYLDNDKIAMAAFFVEDNPSVALEKFMKLLLDDRNIAWAKLIPTYIAEGGTTFFFAGAGHFVGDNSVFEYMKKDMVLEN